MNDEFHDTFFEFTIVQDDLTADVALVITDFTTEDDREETIMLWNSQVADLRHVVGS